MLDFITYEGTLVAYSECEKGRTQSTTQMSYFHLRLFTEGDLNMNVSAFVNNFSKLFKGSPNTRATPQYATDSSPHILVHSRQYFDKSNNMRSEGEC